MTPERWERIQTLYHAALEREPNRRTAFLEQECDGDEGLLGEVESLLAHQEPGESLLAVPALDVAAQNLVEDQGPRWVGNQIGSYKVLSLLGRGGMGEVYLAEDLRLGRKVAIKRLPTQFNRDQERVLRFKREARSASGLNHPNILTIYEIGEADGTIFIATEFIDGKTLRQRLAQQRMKLRELLEVAIQVASGLTAAHEAGIVHRDIKPENIMLRRDGYAKLLDFGLAKLIEPQAASGQTQTAAAPTLTTTSGILMGTAHYMSPEQAMGQEVDHRSDIFSLGAVLYEMASGVRAFEGSTATVVIGAILHQSPKPVRQLDPEIPIELERIIHEALEKDREVRYQTASGLRADLKRLQRDADSGQATAAGTLPRTPANKRPKRRWRKWATMATTTIILGCLLAISYFRAPLPPPKILRYVQLTSDGQQKLHLVTDGSRLYFDRTSGGPSTLAQVSATGGETLPVPTPFENCFVYDISPSHSELLVGSFSPLQTKLPLWLLPVPGGSARRLGDLLAADGTWSPDGQKILYALGRDLYLAKGDGTEARKIVTAGGFPAHPRWSPDGTKLRFSIYNSPNQTSFSSLWEVSADGTNLHPLLPGWNNPSTECCGNWTPDGKYFVFQSEREGMTNIWAIREQRGFFRKSSGEPVQLTQGPISLSTPVPSVDGQKLFVVGTQRRGELVRYDAKSGQFVPYLSGISAEHLNFSRDGEWVAYITYPETTLWRSKVDGTSRLQLTFPPMRAILPHWSPDGERIAFVGRTAGNPWKVYTVSAEGGTGQQLLPGAREEHDPDWSPNGDSLIFGRNPFTEAGGGFGPVAIQLVDVKTRQLSTLPGSEGLWAPAWSPDGRYVIALGSPRRLMLFEFATQKWAELDNTISKNYVSWSADGKYIYFDTFETDATISRVRVSDRRLEQVVNLKDLRRHSGSWAGPWFGLAPDDSPLLLRSAGSQEIYALEWEAP